MPDYKSMYFKLFNKVTDAIGILQNAQIEEEDEYVGNKDEPILIPRALSIDELCKRDDFDEFMEL